MRPVDSVKLEIKVGNTWTDYSDGIIDVGIIRGCQGYKYIWQQPEAGVMTLITRNPDLDPYANNNVRSNKYIRLKNDSEVFFTGRISEINVDYQPKGEPPQITLVAIDLIGTMGIHILKDTFADDPYSVGYPIDIKQIFDILEDRDGGNPAVPVAEREIIDFPVAHNEDQFDLLTSGCAAIVPSGSTALSVATTVAQGNIQFFYADKNNSMNLYPRMDAKKTNTAQSTFDSRGGATSYKEIELTDNFDTLCNQLTIRNRGYNTNTIPLYQNTYSVSEWGPAGKEFPVQIYNLAATQNVDVDKFRDVIFQDSAHPSKEIYSITWDATTYPEKAALIDIMDNIQIYHEADPEDIDRKYGVIGIEHRITANSWTTKYYLKNHYIYESTFPTPIIESNHSLGASINEDVIFNISNAADMDLTTATYSWQYTTGTTGNTPGAEFSSSASPTVNYALANVGLKKIICYVTDAYGFTKASEIYTIQIYGAAPTAVTTSYVVNTSDSSVYTFTATTTEATTYTFHWGDGTTYTTTNNMATHKYTTGGAKSVYVVAANEYGTTQSATTNITVTIPATPAAEVGTFPLRYIAFSFRATNVATAGTVLPYFAKLQLNTSAAGSGDPTTNPALNRALIGDYETYVNKTPNSSNLGLAEINRPEKIKNQTPSPVNNPDWCVFTMPTSGLFNPTFIYDMSAPYYDIKTIKLDFLNYSSTQTISGAIIDVYITDNLEATFNFDSCNWWKIGEMTTGTMTPNQVKSITMVPSSGYTMPFNAQPFTNFSYTISNQSETIRNNRYSFTTDNFSTASYLWNFGDGNTSTLQNPVHDYASSGSKTVTLTKYDQYGNTFSSTQTFTVNRQTVQTGTFPVRYIKLKQNSFTASTEFYSPCIANFIGMTSAFNIDRFFNKRVKSWTNTGAATVVWQGPTATTSSTPITITNGYPASGTMNGYEVYPNNRFTIGYNNQNSWSGSGARPMATVNGTTGWEIVWDLGEAYYDIDNISAVFNRAGVGTSTSTRPTYEVYFSSNNSTWTKVGNLSTPGSMPNSGYDGWYSSTMTETVTLPLNI
jgi:PKD repeat protein